MVINFGQTACFFRFYLLFFFCSSFIPTDPDLMHQINTGISLNKASLVFNVLEMLDLLVG